MQRASILAQEHALENKILSVINLVTELLGARMQWKYIFRYEWWKQFISGYKKKKVQRVVSCQLSSNGNLE